MRPGAKFSTTTSARSTMRRNSARPSGFLRSMVTLRLLALKTRKNIASSPGTSGRLRRDCSPPGGSILMTSAPSQPRNWVQVVPASNWVRSRIRMPLSARSAMARPPTGGTGSLSLGPRPLPRRPYGSEVRRLRPHRARARAPAGPDLPRAPDPDRAAGAGGLPRLPPRRAPHAGHPQPGALPERLPGRRGRTHDAPALRTVRVRAAAPSSAAVDRGDQYARQPERRPAGDRRRPRRRDGGVLLGPGGRLRDELRALPGDAGHPARGPQPRRADLRRPVSQLRQAADVPPPAAAAVPAALVHAQPRDGGHRGHAHDHRRLDRRPGDGGGPPSR